MSIFSWMLQFPVSVQMVLWTIASTRSPEPSLRCLSNCSCLCADHHQGVAEVADLERGSARRGTQLVRSGDRSWLSAGRKPVLSDSFTMTVSLS